MAILAQCPICRQKQSVKNRLCKCGQDLVKAKKAGKVKYWVGYQLTNKKQRREVVGYSIEDARARDAHYKDLKKKNPVSLELAAAGDLTFAELAKWYLALGSVKRLASFRRVSDTIRNFNRVLGGRRINSIRLFDLEEFQIARFEEGKAPRTVDYEIGSAKTMMVKAFDNDLIDGNALKPFRGIKKALKRGSNVRSRIIAVDEYVKLLFAASGHLKAVLVVAFNSGMRLGELMGLKWKSVDLQTGFIRLGGDDTKEGRPKVIPINENSADVFRQMARQKMARDINHDRVFTFEDNPISNIKRTFQTCCKDAEIPYGRKVQNGITFHDIRRSVKTNMLRAGVDKIFRDIILGHAHDGMDVHYMAPTEADLEKAMTIFTKWFDQEVTTIAKSDQDSDQDSDQGQTQVQPS